MNFNELKQELFDRGTDYLEETPHDVGRAERWLNNAYHEICNLHSWPFLEDQFSGVPPLDIPALRRIRFVRLTAKPWYYLDYMTEDELVHDGFDLTKTGLPSYYYLKDVTQVKTCPVSAESIDVGYIMRPQSLSGIQTPLFEEEYHNLIVDRAMIKAYQDSDNFEAAAALRAEFDAEVQGMAEDYQVNTRDVFYIDPGDPYDG